MQENKFKSTITFGFAHNYLSLQTLCHKFFIYFFYSLAAVIAFSSEYQIFAL